MIILFIILAIIIFIIGLCAIRTIIFVPKKEEKRTYEEVNIDKDSAIKSLAELVKCKTISYYDHDKEDDGEFEKLVGKLPELFPNVFKNLSFKRFEIGRALLFHWKGKEEGPATVLMAHYDVVPIEIDQWTHKPFDAEIKDGIMWGRGTLDTKVTFNGILSAAENLLKQNFTPKYDIYFAFSGGEEINGPGAKEIVKYFSENHIELECVVDEGGAVVKDVFPGVKEDCGLIGIAEKGLMNLKFEVNSNGGHASAPSPHTPVGVLSKACYEIEDNPFTMHIDGPASLMFDTLGRHSSLLYRIIFANLWLFKPVLNMLCKKNGGELNALVRTTCAFTQMTGSKAPNVIPPTASMVANFRLNPYDTTDSAIDYVKKIIDNNDINVSMLEGYNPSKVSRVDVDGYRRVKEAIEDTWKGTIVSPYLMVQCSDSRHYSSISDRVYRFSAMDLTSEERKTIHGNDEHIRLETIGRAVEFFYRVIKNS